MRVVIRAGGALALLLTVSCPLQAQEAYLINSAIQQAIITHPNVGEAAANRRATESELRQQQSTLLPQIRVEGRAGPERFDQNILVPPLGNGQWMNGRSVS